MENLFVLSEELGAYVIPCHLEILQADPRVSRACCFDHHVQDQISYMRWEARDVSDSQVHTHTSQRHLGMDNMFVKGRD